MAYVIIAFDISRSNLDRSLLGLFFMIGSTSIWIF